MINPQPKRIAYRNAKITQAAKDEDCTICGINDSTIVFAHFDEQYAGKGIGQKADDCAGLFLCAACHAGLQKIEVREVLRGYYRTIRRLLDKGVIK
jgi:hypothetical protein